MSHDPTVFLLEQHYELLRHYSSRLFQAWLSGVTVFVAVWPFLLWRVNGRTFRPVFDMPGVAFAAVATAGLLVMIFLMGNAYYAKYLVILRAGVHLEKRLLSGSPMFCVSYNQLSHFPVYLFQILSVLVLIAYGYNQDADVSWLLAVAILLLSLVVYIVYLERTLRGIRNNAKS